MDTKTTLEIVATFACLLALPAMPDDHRGSGCIDGSVTVTCGTSTMLFAGAVPPNGFIVQPFRTGSLCQRQWACRLSDRVFLSDQNPLTTPPGYKRQ
jgi:hypothetical protein